MATTTCLYKSDVLAKLLVQFPTTIIDEKKSTDSEIVFRTAIEREDEVEEFKTCLSQATNTCWNAYREPATIKRFFSRVWICQHSKKNKTNLEAKKYVGCKRNAACNAKLHIIVKNVTKNIVKKDIFLRQKPALRGEIKIGICHSHSTTSAEALRMLRVNDEVKDLFHEYFSSGMTVAEALKFHENRYLVEEDFKSLANAAINPTCEQIRYLHDCWRYDHLGSVVNPFEKLKEKIPFYEANGEYVYNELFLMSFLKYFIP
ncbi:uncharacterized protein [Parasteatoda tepidariorum]|uniref:uncharacterized protein n=1 Tax=Parasteatoda tepidariorum TaxID=114398 RepID=UPI0039BCD340